VRPVDARHHSTPPELDALTAARTALVALREEKRPAPARQPVAQDSTEEAPHRRRGA
jgi:hypothetical protein